MEEFQLNGYHHSLINKVLEKFDFDKVLKVMSFLDWHSTFKDAEGKQNITPPNVNLLFVAARNLLERTLTDSITEDCEISWSTANYKDGKLHATCIPSQFNGKQHLDLKLNFIVSESYFEKTDA